MKKRFWLLGSRDDLALVGRTMAAALDIRLVEHESGYRGGAYLRGSGGGLEEVIVQANFEDDEGELAEVDFPTYRTLAYITQRLESSALPSLTDIGIQVLRVEEL
jgi:hypothetical protein